jgi:mono/diheme cytochrome c family protein
MLLRRPLSGVALALAAAVLAAGCGTGGKASAHADAQNGAALFTAKCGACHVLAAAGTQGTVGPNLDDAFGPSRQQGFKQSTIQDVVLDQIREPSAPMPKDLVTGADAQDVAAYVASVAGVGGATAKPPSQVGPNLDELKPPLARVKHQVEVGGGVMPAFKGKLTPAQIAAVAKFVASSAGK